MFVFRPVLLCVVPILLSFVAVSQPAGLSIQPGSVYMHDSNRSASISIGSSSSKSVQVSMAVAFGFNNPDLEGGTGTFIDAKDPGNPKSCAAWTSLDQTSITLEPGQTRCVRIEVTPPEGLKDGEYWASLILQDAQKTGSAQDGASTVDTAANLGVVPIAYRKGDTYADVKLAKTDIVRNGNTVTFSIDLQALGNSAYHGNLKLLIRNAKGKDILSKKMRLSVYTLTRFDFEISGERMPPGIYKASLAFDGERPDLGDAALLILPKSYTVDFRLP